MRQYGEGYVLERDDLQWSWDHYLAREEDAAHPYASPLCAPSLEGLPPALVITAELDPLRDQGEAYASRLRASGVRTRTSRYGGMIHSFVDYDELDAARQALGESANALSVAWFLAGARVGAPPLAA